MCISVVAGGVEWYILVAWWEIVVEKLSWVSTATDSTQL